MVVIRNIGIILILILVGRSVRSQQFDPYYRVSDPRAICRLDGADTLPVQISSGVGWVWEHDSTDNYYIIAQGQGSGVLTHIWLMYYDLPADSLMTVKIWIDDSLVISSYLYDLFRQPHGALHYPFDSLASGGLNCDVQLPYRRNFRITYYAEWEKGICCLFWGIEHRPFADSLLFNSFRLQPGQQYLKQQQQAESIHEYKGSPWKEAASSIPFGNTIEPHSIKTIADIFGPGMIQEMNIHVTPDQYQLLRNTTLKIYWDNSPQPSVSVPLLDYFGCSNGFRNVNALQLRATEQGELASYFPMPFYVHAKIVLENPNDAPINFSGILKYSNESVDRYTQGYFLSQFYETPKTRWHVYHPVGKLLGRGKFIGVHYAFPENPPPYFMEGDPYIYIDSDLTNRIHYTGLEDYLTGGWFFSDSTFSLPFAGCTQLWSTSYRFHYFDAYDFHKSFDFEQEHGVRNDFQSDYRTTSFFYKRWTPFWPERDTIKPGELWSVEGSGYSPNESVTVVLGTQHLFSTTADKAGHFFYRLTIPDSINAGTSLLQVNNYTRPEPITVLSKPTVCILYDTTQMLFRYGDSVRVHGSGFVPGEKISIYLNNTEANYLPGDRTVAGDYSFDFPISIPWVKDGSYRIRAQGNFTPSAVSDSSVSITRVKDYEAEDMKVVLAEGYTESSYLGYKQNDNWSNQYSRYYAATKVGDKLILSFKVPVADTFRVSSYHILGSRYADFDVSVDSKQPTRISCFLDTDVYTVFRSPEVNLGTYYLDRGEHTITYTFVEKGKASEFSFNADNILLTPVSGFHDIPVDTTGADVLPTVRHFANYSFTPNPLRSTIENIHISVDNDFHLGSDRLSIELFNLLGKKVATVVNGTLGVSEIDFTHDCSGLANGAYYWLIKATKQGKEDTQTIPFVIER